MQEPELTSDSENEDIKVNEKVLKQFVNLRSIDLKIIRKIFILIDNTYKNSTFINLLNCYVLLTTMENKFNIHLL